MAEARLVIDRSPQESKGPGKLSEARDSADAIKARRKQIHEQAKTDAAGAGLGPEPREPDPAPEREDLESIEITLRDGRVIEYGPPANISLSDRIARLYSARSIAEGGPDPGLTEYRLTRLLMGVRSIDGKQLRPITSLVDRTALANRLGDQAIDLLNLFDGRHWPPLQAAEIPLVKKNLRQS